MCERCAEHWEDLYPGPDVHRPSCSAYRQRDVARGVCPPRMFTLLLISFFHIALNSLHWILCLSALTAILQVNPGLLVINEAKDDGGGGDNWSHKSCKAPVKSSPPTNQHPVFYRPDALPVAQPTVSKHWRENIAFHGLAYPKLTCGLSTLSLTTNNSSWLSWGGLSCLSY